MSGYDVTCRHLIEFLADYLDGTLPDKQRDDFIEHLRLCPPCVRYLDTYEATIRLEKDAMKSAGAQPLPEMPPDLVKAILASLPKKKPD
jgi:anti-sigma factor RsiW